ncbi:MAG: 2-oxoglutarate dehydrogenase E1 component [Mariniblastus sp.]|jgi:2-oxoglutarate dehydrogenase E1 component
MNVFSRAYIDSLFDDFQQDPSSLPPEWQVYFETFDPSAETFDSSSLPTTTGALESTAQHLDSNSRRSVAQLQDRVDQLIRGYRVRGHLEARIDPLGRPREANNELNLESYGLLPSDFSKKFSARTVDGNNFRTLEEIVDLMRQTYCRSIGVQFMHIDDHHVRNWLQSRMEGSRNRMQLHRKTQLRILTKLTDAVIFEEFMRKKFLGAKTFSLEGAETLIPLLDLALEKAGDHGVKQVVLGMAHRGRLNVLANIMGKRAQNIFWGFNDPDPETHRGGGDVLYHLGHSNDWVTSKGKPVHISLCFNPSHLEFVNPVAMGRCRSKQDRDQDVEQAETLTVLIHGDAAFAGEGIVQETLNMSQLDGYKVGGTLHVIVNNQVGFTTDWQDSRSTTYASDVAKMLQIPIFHVNGEDPEAVAQVVNLAMEFRREFARDVVIDMYCYRRLGHNESDEPRFTQPLMYKTIDSRPTIRDSYLKRLLKMQEVTQEEADRIAEDRASELQEEFEATKKKKEYAPDTQTMEGLWTGYYGGTERSDDEVSTGVDEQRLVEVIRGAARVPEGFNLHRKLKRVLDSRTESADGKRPIDWATAELAAFGTLAVEGHPVRLSGQDSGRGTFSQRHSVLHDTETAVAYTPLQHLEENQAAVNIINSPLSEAGVLGFDYGYSLDAPDSLIIWEAQFGDFFNAAQVIVDQFICSAEDKWDRLSGLTMLLPHGFEGAGPEHCSARLERFLTSTAEHNIQIALPTTSAQHFHLLRRQVKRGWRKPLVVFTPKSLLREPFVMSPISDFTSGHFKRVIFDETVTAELAPDRVLLTAGKIGVDLLKDREKSGRTDFAVIRVEQLYPLPYMEIEACLSQYPSGTEIYWVQEEPRNMGAWYFMKVKWDEFGLEEKWPLKVVCRPESASPSTGSKKAHKIEQDEIMNAAMGIPKTVNA